MLFPLKDGLGDQICFCLSSSPDLTQPLRQEQGATTATRASATLCVTSHSIVHTIRLMHLKNC